MDSYKVFYDNKFNEFSYIAYDSRFNPYTNFSEVYGEITSQSKDWIVEVVGEYNELIRTNSVDILYCKDCRKYFILTKSEKEWFESRGLDLPRRCPRCRNKNKDKKGYNLNKRSYVDSFSEGHNASN